MNEVVTDIGIYGSIGGLLPPLLAILNRPSMPPWLKQLIMVVVAIVVGALAYGAENGWDFSSTPAVLAAVVGVVTATQIAYRGLWRHGAAQAIERNVNGGPQAAPVDVAPEIDEDIDEEIPPNDDYEPKHDYEEEPVDGDAPDAYVDNPPGLDDKEPSPRA